MKDDKGIVCLEGVNKFYRSNSHKCTGVKDINLNVHKGELLLLLGPSGSGKTTLLTLIAGLLEPTSGKVFLYNENISEMRPGELQLLRAKKIGFIFQTFLLIDSLTAIQNIELVLRFAKQNKKYAGRQAFNLLKQFGIEELAYKSSASLSQGEKQRVAVARAIANNADLILADEPTASLETNQGMIIIELLHKYATQQDKCVIVASHDLRLKEYADRIIYLQDGEIIK
jgi:putative ABC transport system ATP-binding protein